MGTFCKISLTKAPHQRGAMFGLDARLTIAILAGLAIVSGAAMSQVMKDRRTDKLLFEQEKLSAAVSDIQEDLRTNIHDSLTASDDDEKAYMALVDSALIKTDAENLWFGPYMQHETSNNHRAFGKKTLIRGNLTNASTENCTPAEIRSRECFYYYKITDVPITLIEATNERLDTGESTPENEGGIQWSGSNDDATIYMRLGLVAP